LAKKKEAEKPVVYKSEWEKERDEFRERWKFARKINEYSMKLISLQWQGDNVFHTGKRVNMAIPGEVIDLAKGIACWNTPVKIFILGNGKCRVTVGCDLAWKIEKMLYLYNHHVGYDGPGWQMRQTYTGYDGIYPKSGPDYIAKKDTEEVQQFGYFYWYLPNDFRWQYVLGAER
jgi:hypothetical protein